MSAPQVEPDTRIPPAYARPFGCEEAACGVLPAPQRSGRAVPHWRVNDPGELDQKPSDDLDPAPIAMGDSRHCLAPG